MFIEMMVFLMLHYKPVNFSGIKVLNPYLNIYTHEFKKILKSAMGVGNLIKFVELIVRSYFRLILSTMLYANQTYCRETGYKSNMYFQEIITPSFPCIGSN